MARQPRQLIMLHDTSFAEDEYFTDIHFDKENTLLAVEHYGYYLMSTLTETTKNLSYSSRIYLSLSHKQEYYDAKVLEGDVAYKRKASSAEHLIFDIHKDKIDFLKHALEELFKELKNQKTTVDLLRGLSLLLKLFNKKINLESIYEIETSYQHIAYELLRDKELDTDANKKLLGRFFSELEEINGDFERDTSLENAVGRSKSLKGYPSSVVYQLEFNAKQELKEIKHKVEEYDNWINETENIFTPENVARTFLDDIETNGKRKSRYQLTLVMLMKKYADIDMYILLSSQMLLDSKENEVYLKTNEVVTVLAINGLNIDDRTVKMHLLLHRELFPDYPYIKKFDKNYINPDIKIGQSRKWLSKYNNSDIDAMDQRQYPLMNTMYPFVLLMMIRHGLNLEVLADWKVQKNKEGIYEILGDSIEMFTIIDAVKNRSNSQITTVLKNDSLEKKYLDFYIKWATPLYEKSGNNKLFQYGSFLVSTGKQIHTLSSRFFTNVKNSSNSFYHKYEIIDSNDKRIMSIDHRRLRVSHNHQNYLQGKTEYERQINKSHEDGETTNSHYEEQAEWKGSKNHKVASAQNLVVGVFTGEISREENKTAELFNGPMADCKNNKEPTFNGAPSLKENQVCSDWTKCLTQCNKSRVIPKIHGPVIYAWIDYLKNQRDEFVRDSDWEKEYLVDKESAEDTVSRLTEVEKKYAIENSYKHENFVKMRFAKVTKMERINNV